MRLMKDKFSPQPFNIIFDCSLSYLYYICIDAVEYLKINNYSIVQEINHLIPKLLDSFKRGTYQNVHRNISTRVFLNKTKTRSIHDIIKSFFLYFRANKNNFPNFCRVGYNVNEGKFDKI